MITDSDLATLSTSTGLLAEQLAVVDDQQWNLETPCEDWDLRALVDHVAGGNWFTLGVLSGASADASLGQARERFAGGSPTADQVAQSASDQLAGFRQPDALDRQVHHIVGDLSGRDVLRLRLHDLIVHTWDIKQTLGSTADLPVDLALWGLAEIRSAESVGIRHFEIDTSQLLDAGESMAGYLGLFGRGVAH